MIGLFYGVVMGYIFILVFIFLPNLEDKISKISNSLESLAGSVEDFVDQSKNYLNLPEKTATKLREMSKAKLHETPADQDSYLAGLKDGATMTAQFALGELAEESN
jgi:hypothetical protein